MLTALFVFLMFAVFGKMIMFALKAAWGLSKILVTLVFLPVILVVMVIVGLIKLAIPVLLIIGVVTVIRSMKA